MSSIDQFKARRESRRGSKEKGVPSRFSSQEQKPDTKAELGEAQETITRLEVTVRTLRGKLDSLRKAQVLKYTENPNKHYNSN
jgi:hypothetical protein